MTDKNARYERGYKPGMSKEQVKIIRDRFFGASYMTAIALTVFYMGTIIAAIAIKYGL